MLLDQGYSAEFVKVLRGGYISWESLGYPIATADVPAGGALPGSQPIQVVPGATVQIQVGTPVPGVAPAAP